MEDINNKIYNDTDVRKLVEEMKDSSTYDIVCKCMGRYSERYNKAKLADWSEAVSKLLNEVKPKQKESQEYSHEAKDKTKNKTTARLTHINTSNFSRGAIPKNKKAFTDTKDYKKAYLEEHEKRIFAETQFHLISDKINELCHINNKLKTELTALKKENEDLEHSLRKTREELQVRGRTDKAHKVINHNPLAEDNSPYKAYDYTQIVNTLRKISYEEKIQLKSLLRKNLKSINELAEFNLIMQQNRIRC